MLSRLKYVLFRLLSVLLSVFILAEVNYPQLSPQSQLSIFALLGLSLVYLKYPIRKGTGESSVSQATDLLLVLAVCICFGFILIQTEPTFKSFWLNNQALGNRAGLEHLYDHRIGLLGLLLVLEATRRAIGITLPLLALSFLLYAAYGSGMPDWFFPHRGYDWERIVSQTFLHSQGVFGIALKVMFTYVFLFVLFGAILEKTGATEYIITTARRLFQKSTGGPAKVAVISSGLMGSLSGSAVANTATTGTFTIPLMRASGFRPAIAGGIEAAASSGGALVPPIMGAGAYMMLEIVEPAVTYLQIIKAALVPALLYYTALLLIVHFHARRIGAAPSDDSLPGQSSRTRGFVFLVAFFTLILFLVLDYTPFRAISLSLLSVLLISSVSAETRIRPSALVTSFERAAHGGVSLIAAASCVGIIIGVVTLTGIGTKLPGAILPLAQNNLILALILLMISTIILGMGLPSAVCYLLMATLVGPILGDLGLVPLAAHLFIFYFGMMSMVTPPVALAAYTAAAIAESGIMATGFAAFRFALVGFALPYAFVLRPELLLLAPAGFVDSFLSILITLAGIIPLAAGIAGFGFAPIPTLQRFLLVLSALTLLLTPSGTFYPQVLAFSIVLVIAALNRNGISTEPKNGPE